MSRVSDEALASGRDALERHAWQEAYDALSQADRDGKLGGEGLRLLAEASWWTAHPDEVIDILERAYGAFLKEGDAASAAMIAFEVVQQQGSRGAFPQAMGWMAKAERLAAEDPEMPVHGWLEFARALFAFFQGDLDRSLTHYELALEIAERTGDRDLHAMSLHDKGHTLCVQGKVAEGLAMIDEAMVAAVAGELRPMSAGYVYCAMIAVCSRLGDYGRAAEWTEATTRWCERHSIPAFPGVCRVHRAELLRLRGAWPKAEEEARRACEELPRFNLNSGMGHAFYEIGEIRRRMGDLTGAEEAYERAHEFGRTPQPGMSLLRLAQGKIAAAAVAIRQAVAEAGSDQTARARRLAAQAEIAVAAGDLETAAAAVDELDSVVEGFDATALKALAAGARGAVRLAQGEADGAIGDLRRALQGWQQIDAPYEVAEVRVALGKAYRVAGDEEAAAMELKAARTAFERLGASALAAVTDLLGQVAAAAGPPERVDRAFMFTDIERSTDLVGVIGDEAWEDLLSWHDQKLRSIFASHGGEVAHHTGDGFFVAFEDARGAVASAVAVQRALAEHRREHGFALQVRIGVHAAQATRRGMDYSGAEVHKAARIAAEAQGGEILASAETLAQAGKTFAASEPRPVTVKGITEPVEVATVEWR